MKNMSYLLVLFIAIGFYSCNTESKKVEIKVEQEVADNKESSEFLINATLWVQNAAEYRACCYQSFNYAKLALDNNLKTAKKDKPSAIVLDIDETVMDNSYFEAYLVQNDSSYSNTSWKAWSDMQCATATPGAIEFLKYAQSKNVEIVYISNRLEDEKDGTIANMKKLGFPEVSLDNFYFKTDKSDKDARRAMVTEKFNIVLLVGDNLADFNNVLDDRSVNNGFENVDNQKNMFGSMFIILPNPMYGNWEKPLKKDPNKTGLQNKKDALIYYDEVCK